MYHRAYKNATVHTCTNCLKLRILAVFDMGVFHEVMRIFYILKIGRIRERGWEILADETGSEPANRFLPIDMILYG